MARWDKGGGDEIPDWFWDAVETRAEGHTVEVEECDVFYRTWEIPRNDPCS